MVGILVFFFIFPIWNCLLEENTQRQCCYQKQEPANQAKMINQWQQRSHNHNQHQWHILVYLFVIAMTTESGPYMNYFFIACQLQLEQLNK